MATTDTAEAIDRERRRPSDISKATPTTSDPSQFTTDRAYSGQWTITFSNPPINMFAPNTIVELGALMTELETNPSVKVVVFQSANPEFFVAHLDVSKAGEQPEALALWRDFVLRLSSTPVVSIAKIRGRTRARVRNIGYGVPSDFELNFGRYLPVLGREDDDASDARARPSSLEGVRIGSPQLPKGKP